jgi:hypothetical protein
VTLYTMMIVATVDAPDKAAAEQAMVDATRAIGGAPFGSLTSVVAEGDWSLLIPQTVPEFMIAANNS